MKPIALAILLLSCLTARATEYFLSPQGDDSKSGLSEPQAMHTWDAAQQKLTPGDTVTLLDGTYPSIQIAKSGNPSAWLTIRALHPHSSVISLAAGWHNGSSRCVDLSHVSYVKVIGLSVVGCAATDHTVVDSQDGININGSHHIIVQNCKITDCAGSGIGGYDKYWDNTGLHNGPLDFITIEDNEISGCAYWCKYLSSGISVCNAKDAGLGPDPSGFNFVIRNNICHNNENKIGEYTKNINNVATATDGNGIIIDYFTPNNHYPYNILVEGNLCYDNGGRGIHVFNSANTTVRYNTCWHNNRNKLDYAADHNQGDMSCVFASNVQISNNIAVSNTNSWSSALTVDSSSNIKLSNNLLAGPRCIAHATNFSQTGTITSDPLFINPQAGPSANFRLQLASPASNLGAYASRRP